MIKQMKEKILHVILPLLAGIFIRILFRTIRLKVVGEEMLEGISGRIIYACWHGQQFLLVPYMSQKDILLMSSLSRDGEYITRALQGFGYKIVRGSSAKGGMRGLVGLIKGIRDGRDCVLTVDGPVGPIHEPKKGIIFLARKTGAYIVPLVSTAKRKWTFEAAWDKYILPKPFSQGVIAFGQPYKPEEDTPVQQECDILRERLNELSREAD